MNIRKVHRVFQLLREGVEKSVFPGAVCGISKEGQRFIVACGYLSLTPFLEPAEDEHLYDLASLTKPLSSALSLINKVSRGEKIDLSSPLKVYLPELEDLQGETKILAGIPLFRLLNHTAGLKAWLPLYRHKPLTLSQAKNLILKEDLAYLPGQAFLYSDLGYFLLTYLLETFFKTPLAHLFEEAKKRITFSRRALLLYKPLDQGIDVERIAPTSVDEEKRVILRGVVEDENTRTLGGVSGVAGLFGNVHGVLDLLEALLSSYQEGHPFPQELVRTFVGLEDRSSSFALGFMKVSYNGYTAFSNRFSPKAFGHLGFTGPSFLVDPERNLVVVLLTNRVHPDRTNDLIKEFRPVFHELVVELFG